VKTASPADPASSPDPALADLLPAFLLRRAEDARLLRIALDRRDYATIGSIGHRLKGLGSTYGFDPISRFGRLLENAAASCDADLAGQTIADYARFLEELA
jgi:HPt (histidine-containing phosphotransfer) domain-containing protein